jgi:hypothetical protein
MTVRVVRTWKRDGSRSVMPGEVAVDTLCKSALDADLRRQGAEAIRQRLTRGEAVETPHAVYVNVLAAGDAAKALATLTAPWRTPPAAGRVKVGVVIRRQAFRALVSLQDEGVGADDARAQVAAKYGVPEWQVREIEEEGLAKDWALE